jgi:hypothetical protein
MRLATAFGQLPSVAAAARARAGLCERPALTRRHSLHVLALFKRAQILVPEYVSLEASEVSEPRLLRGPRASGRPIHGVSLFGRHDCSGDFAKNALLRPTRTINKDMP